MEDRNKVGTVTDLGEQPAPVAAPAPAPESEEPPEAPVAPAPEAPAPEAPAPEAVSVAVIDAPAPAPAPAPDKPSPVETVLSDTVEGVFTPAFDDAYASGAETVKAAIVRLRSAENNVTESVANRAALDADYAEANANLVSSYNQGQSQADADTAAAKAELSAAKQNARVSITTQKTLLGQLELELAEDAGQVNKVGK